MTQNERRPAGNGTASQGVVRTHDQLTAVGPYADAAWTYVKAGWTGVLPVGRKPAQKSPPPAGYTGWAGRDPSGADVEAWIQGREGSLNVALHVPAGVYVPDFDVEGRREELERAAGVLFPPTWTSTSRGAGSPRRQAFYRASLPEGCMWMDHPRPGMDSVHIGHRYAVVWPSVHPDTGERYEWYDPEGELYEGVPEVEELAELPAELVAVMSKEGAPLDGTAADDAETMATLQAFRIGRPCRRVQTLLTRELDRIAAGRELGSIRKPGDLYALVAYGIEGHAGVGAALTVHQQAYVTAREEARGERAETASGDWWRQVRGAVGKKLAEVGGAVAQTCGCDLPETSLASVEGEELSPAEDTAPPSWHVEDLTAVLNGERTRVEPELARRQDGQPLLYRGKEHAVAGEPESGKTWFALMCARDVLVSGGRVLYVDFEDDAFTVVGRLLDLGVLRDRLRPEAGQFRYVRPEGPPRRGEVAALLTFPDGPADLLVYDGWTEGAALMGQDIMSQDDIARWRQALVKPALSMGTATLTTDHVVKDREARGRYSIGAQHKLAGLTGVMFTMEVTETWGRGNKGRSKVLITKDRNGGLRPHGKSTKANLTHIGDLVGDASSGEMRSLILWPPFEDDEDGLADGAPPQHLSRAVDAVLEVLSGRTEPLNTREVLSLCRNVRKVDVGDALIWLAHNRKVTQDEGPRGAKLYRLAEAAEPPPF